MLLVVLFVFNLNITKAEASGDISIFVNSMKQSYSQPPIIENGRTLVPLRGIFETLGASVQWNPETKTIDAAKGNTSVWLKIGSTSTKVNGKTIIISTPAQIRNGRTLVPLRFISESLGDSVVWNNESKTAYIGESENLSQENALREAESYLEYAAFSKQGLIEQLEFEGFSKEDATFAVENIETNWKEQAVKQGKSYLEYMAFSKQGLIEQLEFEGFSKEQATYAVDKIGL